jgi:hypothetical protein
MKRNYLLITGLIPLALLLQSYGGDTKYPGGSPGGYTGSPGDAKNCVQCHGGSATSATGYMTSDVPPGGYVPGTTYTITITLTGSSKKGFEVSPQTPTGALVGTLTAGAGTHLVNGNKAVTQNSGSNANPYVKTFSWTAPVAGTGNVTFYGAFTLNEPVTKLCTLIIPESTTGLMENSVSGGFSVYPNPVNNMINVDFAMETQGAVQLRLFDLTGREVARLLNTSLAGGMHHESVKLPEGLNSGVYILDIQQGAVRHQEKVVVR